MDGEDNGNPIEVEGGLVAAHRRSTVSVRD